MIPQQAAEGQGLVDPLRPLGRHHHFGLHFSGVLQGAEPQKVPALQDIATQAVDAPVGEGDADLEDRGGVRHEGELAPDAEAGIAPVPVPLGPVPVLPQLHALSKEEPKPGKKPGQRGGVGDIGRHGHDAAGFGEFPVRGTAKAELLRPGAHGQVLHQEQRRQHPENDKGAHSVSSGTGTVSSMVFTKLSAVRVARLATVSRWGST